MSDTTTVHIGGSFAPPLTNEILSDYKAVIEATDAKTPVGSTLRILLNCVERWWELPISGGERIPHQVDKVTLIKLTDEIQQTLWDYIPWDYELKSMGQILDTISPETQKPLRDMAFHLLWHTVELCLDREPITTDQLPEELQRK